MRGGTLFSKFDVYHFITQPALLGLIVKYQSYGNK